MTGTGYLCHSDDIADPGSKGFTVNDSRVFAVKERGQIYLYRNSCPHIGVALEWEQDRFLDSSKTLIQCANHGALFSISKGLCVSGPCRGQSLTPVPFELVNGYIRMTINI